MDEKKTFEEVLKAPDLRNESADRPGPILFDSKGRVASGMQNIFVGKSKSELFNGAVMALIEYNPHNGRELASRLLASLRGSIVNFCEETGLTDPTERMVKEIRDRAVSIILDCFEKRWMVVRIEDELPALLLESFDEKRKLNRREKTWGVAGGTGVIDISKERISRIAGVKDD